MRTRVIVPLDGSSHARRAVPVAGWLARERDAELVLMRVVDDPGAAIGADVELEETMLEAGFAGRSVVTDGPDVVDEIVAEAARVDGSIICLASHRGNRVTAASPAATTSGLMQQARCPLVLVGPACALDAAPAKAVVACLDGSEHAERILPLVDDLAATLSLDVWLAQVVAPGGRLVAALCGDVDEAGYIGRCARSMTHPVSNWDVLHGDDPARSILDLCEAHPGTLPALATHGRTGAQLVLHGSVALSVAHRCRAPVVVVPPGA
jgi:nucleotide-binding universal stress UspA family protein